MSDRKRKAAICCLIAASFLALERRKKRRRGDRDEYESKHLNSTMDVDNLSDSDDDDDDDDDDEEIEDEVEGDDFEEEDYEEEDEEEENYETTNNLGIAIKVEPGLTDEDSIAEYQSSREEVTDPLDNMIDIDSTTFIKQEKDFNYGSSLDGVIKIKEEPDLSDDDVFDVLSQNDSKDSSEGFSKSKEASVDVQKEINKVTTTGEDQEISNIDSEVKNPVEVRDECQAFGEFVAGGLRNLKSEDNRKKLKRIIQKVIIKISESEDKN